MIIRCSKYIIIMYRLFFCDGKSQDVIMIYIYLVFRISYYVIDYYSYTLVSPYIQKGFRILREVLNSCLAYAFRIHFEQLILNSQGIVCCSNITLRFVLILSCLPLEIEYNTLLFYFTFKISLYGFLRLFNRKLLGLQIFALLVIYMFTIQQSY